jgi:hypothetical protein
MKNLKDLYKMKRNLDVGPPQHNPLLNIMLKVLYTVCSETHAIKWSECGNLIVTHTNVEDQLTKPALHSQIIYATDAQKLFLHVSALLGFHHQGIFTAVLVVF